MNRKGIHEIELAFVLAVVFISIMGTVAHFKNKKDIVSICQSRCTSSLNTIIRIGNVTHIFECSCDNK